MYSITVNINGKPHTKDIPQDWNDLQWIDYVKALAAEQQNKTDIDAVLETLTGIPKRVLEAMQEFDHRFILTQCSFFWNEQPVKQNLPADFVKVQIENDTWQKLINCEQEFKRVTEENLPQIAAAQLIIKTYSGVDIKGMSVPEALAYWDFFFSNSLIGRNDGKDSMTLRQMRMRLQQELRRSKRLNGLQPVMRLQRVTLPSMIPSLRLRRMSSIQRFYLRKSNRSTWSAKGNTMSLSTKQKTTANE
jgi:hypothetical protein